VSVQSEDPDDVMSSLDQSRVASNPLHAASASSTASTAPAPTVTVTRQFDGSGFDYSDSVKYGVGEVTLMREMHSGLMYIIFYVAYI
jgi:hypothetical protein